MYCGSHGTGAGGAGTASVDIPSLPHLKEQQRHTNPDSDIFEGRPLGAGSHFDMYRTHSPCIISMGAGLTESGTTGPGSVLCFPCFLEPTPWGPTPGPGGDSGPPWPC